eukprot:Mrub_05075.p1 GENE.Mrub_05075~~Mrub_05075.p1  ORF type:complete len:375 (+),score=95.32 Mrub_05075:164-1126(+)
MLNGVLRKGRVRLLLKLGQNLLRSKRNGYRKRKSVRGCIVGEDISTLNLAVVTQGEKVITGLSDSMTPNRKGPKRASKIRKLFSLSADENVCRLVARRVVKEYDNGFKKYKAPKVQRLITKRIIQRREDLKKKKADRKVVSIKLREEFNALKQKKQNKGAKAKKTAQTAKKGNLYLLKKKKYFTPHFTRPKTQTESRNPKYEREPFHVKLPANKVRKQLRGQTGEKEIAHYKKNLDPYALIKNPLLTEAAMKLMEDNNTLVFLVDWRASKPMIKWALNEVYDINVKRVNTYIRMDGTKKAYCKLDTSNDAMDIAGKQGWT